MPKIWVSQATLNGGKKEDGPSMKHLQVMLLPPGWDARPLQGYPPAVCRWYPFIHLREEKQNGVEFCA